MGLISHGLGGMFGWPTDLLTAGEVAGGFATDTVPTDGVVLLGMCMTANHPTHRFATRNDNGYLYKQAIGSTTWEVACAALVSVQATVFSFSNGVLLSYQFNTGDHYNLKRSIDNGATWVEVIAPAGTGGALPEFSAVGYPTDWSFGEGVNGSGVIVEYGARNADNQVGNRIFYTSDYGATWSMVVDNLDLPLAERWHHIHTAYYHAPTQKFLIPVGDTARSRILTLDGDGDPASLATLSAGPFTPQPISFAPYSGDEVIFGDDSSLQIGVLNVSTGALRSVFMGWRPSAGGAYCWCIGYHDGVYYATNWNSQAGVVKWESTVLASKSPLGPWTVIHTLPASANGLRSFGGVNNGKLHFNANTSSPASAHNHYEIEIPVFRSRSATGTVVAPVKTNNETANALTTVAAPAYFTGTLEVAAGLGRLGGNCLKWTWDGSGSVPLYRRMPVCAAANGKSFQTSCWVKPNRNMQFSYGSTVNTNSIGVVAIHFCPANVWTLLRSPLVSSTKANWTVSSYIQGDAGWNSAEYGASTVVLIDHLSQMEAPLVNDYITPQSSSSAVTLAGAVALAGKWAELFHFAPNQSYHRYSQPKYYPLRSYPIRQWTVGEDSRMDLIWEAGVRTTLAGTPTNAANSVIESSTPVFREDMEGSILYVHKVVADAWTAPTTFVTVLVVDYVDATHVVVSANLSAAYAANDEVFVEAPRFLLDIDDNGTTETLYSQRCPIIENCPVGFVVQANAIDDHIIRAWMLWSGAFTPFLTAAGADATTGVFGGFDVGSSVATLSPSTLLGTAEGMPGKIWVVGESTSDDPAVLLAQLQ